MTSLPYRHARLGGALYLVIILCGAFAQGLVMDKLVVSGDAVATAHNILAAPVLWRLGVAANVLVVLCAVPLLWIEYRLLQPVSKALAQLSLLFNGVSLAVEAVSKVFLLLVLPILTNTASQPGDGGFGQLALLANLALKSHDIAFNIALLWRHLSGKRVFDFPVGLFPEFAGRAAADGRGWLPRGVHGGAVCATAGGCAAACHSAAAIGGRAVVLFVAAAEGREPRAVGGPRWCQRLIGSRTVSG